MNKLVLFLLAGNFLVFLKSTAFSYTNSEVPETAGTACNETQNPYLVSLQDNDLEIVNCPSLIKAKTVNITSDRQIYPAYTAAPAKEGNYPAIVLIHSFKGFEPGYQTMVDRIAEDRYVVVAPLWQTYSVSPSDAEVEALIRNSIAYLKTRKDVDSERLALIGFCAGGRYTIFPTK